MLRRRISTPAAGGPIRGLVCRIALAAIAVAGPSARAGFIENHASTRATAGHHPGSVSDDMDSGQFSATSSASDNGGGYSSGSIVGTSSSATAEGSSHGFSLRVEANYKFVGLDVEGGASANASWEDLLFLSTYHPDIVGNTIRLNFRAQGEVFRSGDSLGGGGSSVGLNLAGSSYDVSWMTTSAAYVNRTGNGLVHSGWDSFSGGAAAFDGWTHIDIPILFGVGGPGTGYLGTGGVYFSVNLGAQTGGRASSGPLGADLHAWDPFQFVSVTLPDVGNVTPESLGVGITFDSGISSPNLATVPEPSSLVLCGTGALGFCCFLRRGRKPRETRR
ncbi:hypothetical protein BSF38_05500 [Paludisphaera borealis]|uniref:Ice-binding protein C-terminal domain-containing protein n=1 Tax=Paludisphaera borealis TaxID=1387353 RepID=A0A1U7CYF0_9BACT|nr:hypothetical protein BSF38_05500 [Paludisphaera borealis]